MINQRLLLLFAAGALVAGASACEVSDADLEASGLAEFSVTPSATDVDVLQVDVTGDATLAYSSADAAKVEIFVNGQSAYSDSLDASTDLSLSFDATLPLIEGPNEVVAELSYNGNILSDAFVVNVGEGVQGIAMTTEGAEVSSYDADITVDSSLGYLSDEPATLDIAVNGNIVHSEAIDASTEKTHTSNAVVPLDRDGPNEVVATLRYHGNEMTQRSTISVVPAAPAATFPTWNTDFSQSGNVNVSMDGEWTVEAVEYSIDSGEFFPATDVGSGDYQLALDNLDIGDSALTVRVITSNDGHEQAHLFHDVVAGVQPVFACNQSNNMLPSSNLIRNNSTEIRDMIGYFGDPTGGHTVTFAVRFTDDNGRTFENPAEVLTYGRTSMDVAFNVGRFRCNNNPCSDTYDLTLFVDGQEFCTQNGYGVIFEL